MEADSGNKPPETPKTPIRPHSAVFPAGIEFFGILGIIALVMSIFLVPVYCQARKSSRETGSISNLKHLYLALLTYSADWDHRLPSADRWGDAITGKVPEDKFHDPTLGTFSERPYGYAMNVALSGVATPRIEFPNETVTLFQSNERRKNANGTQRDLRQVDPVTFAFANGSAGRIPVADLATLRWSAK